MIKIVLFLSTYKKSAPHDALFGEFISIKDQITYPDS